MDWKTDTTAPNAVEQAPSLRPVLTVFISSRRRHTRLDCDWSSDVCSSDLAYVHDDIYFSNYDPTETRLALAETSVRAAARLQPDAAETHLVQAIHFYWGYRNYDRARAELAKAQRTLPNNAQIFQFLSLIDRRQSRWDEAIRNLERAVDLDPRNQDMLNDLKDTYYNLRRYEEAIAVAYRALSLQPRNALLRTLPAWIGVDADAN